MRLGLLDEGAVMNRLRRLVILVFALCVISSLNSGAQVNTGAVLGTVTDASGATVPNASVTLKNVETGASLQAQTGAGGDYSFPVVPVGEYELTVTHSGFKTYMHAR